MLVPCLNVQTLTQTNWSKLVETTNQQNKSNQIILILHLDQSLLYIFANYQKRFSITSYGGNVFDTITGFEQVVTNGIPTYYVVDYNRVIQFDQLQLSIKFSQRKLNSNFSFVNNSQLSIFSCLLSFIVIVVYPISIK